MSQVSFLIVLLMGYLLISQDVLVLGKGILFPRSSETREVRNLDGVWSFKISPSHDAEVGFKEEWFFRPLKKSSGEAPIPMPVPSSFNDITTKLEIRDFVGWAWYERNFFVPAAWRTGSPPPRVLLRFGSVHYYAKVWVNGELVVEHEGGHLPFEADVSHALNPGNGAHRLTVAVNNTLHAHSIPQGQVTWPNDTDRYPPGYVINSYSFDFFNYAGIHRPVYLYVVPDTHVDDLTVTSDLDAQKNGEVQFNVEVRLGSEPLSSLRCQARILDSEGNFVASSDLLPLDDCHGTLLVKRPKLWWPFLMRPNPGYLHTFEVRLVPEHDLEDPLDVYRLPFGIRTINWTNSTILVNGEPFYFRGLGRHEDSNVRGKGLDIVLTVKDHNLLRWLGANSYRTSHYPYAEEALDLSDQYGIVVVSESPAVNLEKFDEPLLARHRQVMLELVRRDKNRACVLFWSLANEARCQHPEAEPYFKDVAHYVRLLDETRPLTMATNQGHDSDKAAQFMDVLALNRYFAWYSDTGRLEVIARQMETEVRLWKERYNKPIFISEYGADAVAGLHSDPPSLWTEDYQVALMKENFKAFDKLRKHGLLNGEMIWNFADFATAQVFTRVNGNKKGMFTRERQPKAAAHELRRRYHKLAKLIEKHSVNTLEKLLSN